MAGATLTLTLQERAGQRREAIAITQCVIAGWTGRDPVAVEKHIAELAALGVKRPASTPIFYRVSAARLTTAQEIEAVGQRSSGEVEFVLVQTAGRLWVGVGSDHTDREVETYGVTVSKQMCDKPVADRVWLFDDVIGHWDRLTLRSFAVEGGRRTLYQEGSVTTMRAPQDLIGRFAPSGALAEGTAMFCGTPATHGGIRFAERFEFELEDPVLGRTISHGYTIRPLPILG